MSAATTFTSPTGQYFIPKKSPRPLVNPNTVSMPALVLFRLLDRLSREKGYAHLRITPSEKRPGKSLSEMLGKCDRHVRRLLSELIAAGWIARQCTGRMVRLAPVVTVPSARHIPREDTLKKPFEIRQSPPDGLLQAEDSPPARPAKMSGLMSGLKRQNVRSVEGHTILQLLPGETTTNEAPQQAPQEHAPEGSVVVLSVEKREDGTPIEPEALQALKELAIPEKQVVKMAKKAPLHKLLRRIRAVKQYAARHEVKSIPALLCKAITEEWEPSTPIDAPTHASDRGERPQRPVTTPPEELAKMRAAEQAKQDREAVFEAAWQALDDTDRIYRLEATMKRLIAKGGGYRDMTKKGIESACVVAGTRSEFRAEWEAAHPVGASDLPADHAPQQIAAPQGERP